MLQRYRYVVAIAACSMALWLVACALCVVALGFEATWGCTGLTDDSGFASRQHWSWVPPGLVCEYDLPSGGTHIDRPSEARVLVTGLLVGWPVGTVLLTVAAVRTGESRPADQRR